MNFSFPLNMRFFNKQSAKPVVMPTAAPKKQGQEAPHLKPSPDMLLEDDDAVRLSPRRVQTPARKSEDAFPKLTDGALGMQIAEIMNGVAETLAKSCLYFSPSNLAILGAGPDVAAMLDRMDPLLRATLMDGKMQPEQQVNFRAVAECVGVLKAGAESARLAAQIFLLLHDAKSPANTLAPLKKITDSALRTQRAAAAAILYGDEFAVRTAQKALAETEELGKELAYTLPTMAAYGSPTICRLIAASLYAILVSATSMTEVASSLVFPTSSNSDTLLAAL